MKLCAENTIMYYTYLQSPLCVAGVSTRIGGVSKGAFQSMNLGVHTQDKPEFVKHNRHHFFSTVAPGFRVVHLHQTHSNKVVYVGTNYVDDTEGDAFYTTKRGVLLTVSIADCGSIILHDEDFSVIAAIHCGWRGLKNGIIEDTIKALMAYVPANNLHAYIGPTISQEYYEVGEEFFEYFPHSYIKTTQGKHYFNINSRIEDVLVETGVGRVMNSRVGTASDPEHFFSYRRDGETGRMCAYIGLY